VYLPELGWVTVCTVLGMNRGCSREKEAGAGCTMRDAGWLFSDVGNGGRLLLDVGFELGLGNSRLGRDRVFGQGNGDTCRGYAVTRWGVQVSAAQKRDDRLLRLLLSGRGYYGDRYNCVVLVYAFARARGNGQVLLTKDECGGVPKVIGGG